MKLKSCDSSEKLETIWPQIRDLLSQCGKHVDGAYDLEWVFGEIKAERMQLWYALEETRGVEQIVGCAVSIVVQYPNYCVCQIPLVAGKDGEDAYGWLEYENIIENWARARECEKLEGFGPKAWCRIRPNWYSPYAFLRKDIK